MCYVGKIPQNNGSFVVATNEDGRKSRGWMKDIKVNEEEWILFYARMESAYGLYD